MDTDVIEALSKAGIDTSLRKLLPLVVVEATEEGQPLALEEEVMVGSGDLLVPVRLKSITQLFAGNVRPPAMGNPPPERYALFFALIEQPAMMYCLAAGQPTTDTEFEELYRLLRRRPDSRHTNPLFGYLQAGARLYMSLRDVSQAEFEAVVQRLALSAKHFARGVSSTNYFQVVSAQFRGQL